MIPREEPTQCNDKTGILAQWAMPLFDALRTAAREVISVTLAITATSSAGSTGLLTS